MYVQKMRSIGEYSMRVKKIYLITLWLLLSTVIITGCKQEYEQLDIDFELGYEDSVKVSKGNPLTATIINNGEEFIGELQIEVNQTQSESLIFAKEFQISKNGKKEINMVIPVYTIQRKFKVTVVSEGKKIFEDTIDVGSFISPNQPIVGVISDQPDEYRFLNSSNYNNYNGEQELMDYYYQSVQPKEEIKETNKPKIFYFDNFDDMNRLDNLEFFNYLYIGDNGNLKITDKMEEKLLTWVSKGGNLFVESGEDYKRLYSFVPESITNFKVSSVGQIDKKNLFEKYELTKPLTIVSGTPIDDRSTIIYSEDEIPIVMFTKSGSGQIINILVDLTHQSLDNWNNKHLIIDELLMIGVNGQNSMFGNVNFNNQYSYEYYDMLRYIPIEKNPPYGVMALLFTLYVFISGPVLYFILKKKDRRDLMWVGVPALSMLCLLLLYVFGFGTRYSKPIVNSISNIEFVDGDDYMTIDSKMAVFNNKQGNIAIAWDPDEKIEITSNSNDYYGYQQSSSQKIKGKVLSGNRITYEVFNSPLWSKVDLDASKIVPLNIEDTGEFITFELKDDMIYMSIVNKTPFDLDTAYIQWGSGYIYIGELPAKESMTLEFSMSEIQNDFYDFTNSLYDKYQLYDDQSKMRSNIEMYQRLSDYNRGIESFNDFGSIIIKGVNETPIGYDLVVNDDEADVYDRNIISLKTKIAFTPGTELSLPSGFILPVCKVGRNESDMYDHYIENRDFDDKVVYIYGESYVKFIFDMPSYLDADKVELLVYPMYSEDSYYQKNEFEEIASISNVTYEIYNASIESYETLDILDEFFEVDITKYIDRYNNIIIRMNTDNSDQNLNDYGLIIQVPELTIEGRAK